MFKHLRSGTGVQALTFEHLPSRVKNASTNKLNTAQLGHMDDATYYRLLQLLQQSPHLSQRQLAAELGISLGKVNYCVRALIDKGLLKANNFRKSDNKSAYLYQLTPKGLTEKAALTLRFLQRKEAEHEALLKEIDAIKQDIAEQQQKAGGDCYDS